MKLALLAAAAARLGYGLRGALALPRLAPSSLLPRLGRARVPAEGAPPEPEDDDRDLQAAFKPARTGRDPDRFELKYWVPEALAADVVRHALPYVKADVHDADEHSGGQVNTSLYLDTPDLAFFRAHAEHSPDRFKLRVRAYGDPPAGLGFFEIKRKVNRVTVKTRTDLPLSQLGPLLDGNYDSLPVLEARARKHLEGFLYLKTVTHAEPVVLVRARRTAYASIDPMEDIRVTFDRSIAFQPARGATMDCDPDDWMPIDGRDQHGAAGSHSLLELKFPRVAPVWMRQLTEKLEMRRVAYSKYMWALRSMLESPMGDEQLRDQLIARGG